MAAVDYFLKLDGIKGESTDDKHKGEIDIESFSWGAANASSGHTGGGHGAGKVAMQDLHFVHKVDKASPNLFLFCANGGHIAKGSLVCRKAGKEQQEYLKIDLEQIYVTSVQVGGHQGEIVPSEQFSLSFDKVTFKYYPQKADGSLDTAQEFKMDVKANKIG
jgi:type VI secretion system secreted protein Hcp